MPCAGVRSKADRASAPKAETPITRRQPLPFAERPSFRLDKNGETIADRANYGPMTVKAVRTVKIMSMTQIPITKMYHGFDFGMLRSTAGGGGVSNAFTAAL